MKRLPTLFFYNNLFVLWEATDLHSSVVTSYSYPFFTSLICHTLPFRRVGRFRTTSKVSYKDGSLKSFEFRYPHLRDEGRQNSSYTEPVQSQNRPSGTEVSLSYKSWNLENGSLPGLTKLPVLTTRTTSEFVTMNYSRLIKRGLRTQGTYLPLGSTTGSPFRPSSEPASILRIHPTQDRDRPTY